MDISIVDIHTSSASPITILVYAIYHHSTSGTTSAIVAAVSIVETSMWPLQMDSFFFGGALGGEIMQNLAHPRESLNRMLS